MLRVALSSLDLRHMRVAPGPAPMVEVASFLRSLRSPLTGYAEQQYNLRALGDDMVKLSTLMDITDVKWSPGFLVPALQNSEEALHAVGAASTEDIKRDLLDGVLAGVSIPRWAKELSRPGQHSLSLRRTVEESLRYVFERSVEPILEGLGPAFAAHYDKLRQIAENDGAEAVLNSLHPSIRCHELELEVELVSGADFTYTSNGYGIVLVPSLSACPSVTTSSNGDSPLVIIYPFTAPQGGDAGRSERIRNLHALLGAGRATVLEAVARRPSLSTRALARHAGLSPASVSEHCKVLRSNGLVVTAVDKNGAQHRITDYGKALLGIYW